MTENNNHKVEETAKTSSRIKNIIDRPVAACVIFVVAMSLPAVLLSITENICFFGRCALVVFSFGLYTLLLCLPKCPGIMMVSLLLMVLMNAFQNTVLYLYGESIIAVDMLLNCLTTNTSEASELLGNLLFPMLINAVIYLPLLGWAVYAIVKKIRLNDVQRSYGRKVGIGLLAVAIVFVGCAYASNSKYSVRRQLYPVNVICNIYTALERTIQSNNYYKTSAGFTYHAASTRDDDAEIYVLVIGETSRACNWQLFGYERSTNPLLSQRDDLVLFPKAFSQSNTTHKCVPMMLTPITPADFDSIRYVKSITTAFNEAGYHTAFLSNQPKNRSYTQYFSEEAHNTVYLKKNEHYDMKLLELLKEELNDTVNKKKFIILHSYGSHFNYKDRYPSEYSWFTPDNASQANKFHRTDLVNAYDNTIRYTDDFLDRIIRELDATGVKATMIYTSDHGEDIYDDSRHRFLHASPVPTYYQLHVPLIIWQSDEYAEAYPEINSSLKVNSTKYVAPSQSVFHTIIDMAGLSTPYFDAIESVASSAYNEPEPVYLTDLNEVVPLDESGIKELDKKKFRSFGILK